MELTAAEWRGYRREEFPEGSRAVEAKTLRALATGKRIDLITQRRFRDFVRHASV